MSTEKHAKTKELRLAGVEMLPADQYIQKPEEVSRQIKNALSNGQLNHEALPIPKVPTQLIYADEAGDHYMLMESGDDMLALPYITGSELDLQNGDFRQGGFIPISKLSQPSQQSSAGKTKADGGPAQLATAQNQEGDDTGREDKSESKKDKPDLLDRLNELKDDPVAAAVSYLQDKKHSAKIVDFLEKGTTAFALKFMNEDVYDEYINQKGNSQIKKIGWKWRIAAIYIEEYFFL